MRSAFIETLCDLAARDSRLWLLTGDLGYSVLEPFAKLFPDRFVNAGVAEQNMIGVAAGLASSGKQVFVYSIANFPTFRCLEQIRNDVCYHCMPVCIVSVGAGFAYGPAGYTHHGLEDLAVMRALPGMTVFSPGDPHEARVATSLASQLHGPSYLRLGKAGEPVVHTQQPSMSVGPMIWLRRGMDLTMIATGSMLKPTLDIASELASDHNIDSAVISAPTLKPLDTSTILEAASRPVLVTVEEHSIVGGLGSAVAEVLAEKCTSRPVFRRIGAADCLHFMTGSQVFLRWHAIGNVKQIVLDLVAEAKTPPAG